MIRTRRIHIIILSIIIYLILNYLYSNTFLNKDTTNIYVLNKDVKRGDKLSLDMLDMVVIKNSKISETEYFEFSHNDNYIIQDNYFKGQVLLNPMIINSEEYEIVENKKERVSIKLQESSDAASYKLCKGSIINLYFSAKKSQFDNIFNLYLNNSIVSSNNSEGYITIMVLKEIKVINVYDKYGNELKNTKIKGENNIIDTITIEVENLDAIKINNLINYGKFSVSVLS